MTGEKLVMFCQYYTLGKLAERLERFHEKRLKIVKRNKNVVVVVACQFILVCVSGEGGGGRYVMAIER